ncbi:MAG: metallophosphoesterase [Candidatus Helarchaeota archaeon]
MNWEKRLIKLTKGMSEEEINEMLTRLEKEIKSNVRSTKLLIKNFNKDEIKLIPLGDIHLGDKACDIKLLEGTLEYIENSESYILGMGDYINAGTKHSISDIYSETMNPMSQYETIIEYFEPIKDRLFGIHMGNHEYRIWRESGVNLAKMMAKELNTKYLGFGCFTKLKIKNQNYSIYSTHGSSGAWTPEGKLRAVRRLGESFDADIFLYSHVHDLSVQSEERRKINYKKKIVEKKKKYYVLTGHFLNYEDSYAEMKAYKPGKKGVAKIKFFGDRWDIHCSI